MINQDIKAIVFKHQATTSPTANENRASKGLVLTTATATATTETRASFKYSKQDGLNIERVLFLELNSEVKR